MKRLDEEMRENRADPDIYGALRRAFTDTEELMRQYPKQYGTAGTTATLCVVMHAADVNTLYVANVGDSTAVLMYVMY